MVKEVLSQAAAGYKQQADKKRQMQPSFRVWQLVYLSTKYLKLNLSCKKLGPKCIGTFLIVQIVNPVTVQLRLHRLLGKTHRYSIAACSDRLT